MTTALFCAIVAVINAMGTVAVDTHGARVVSYVPVGGEEVFFASKTGTGGMPLQYMAGATYMGKAYEITFV